MARKKSLDDIAKQAQRLYQMDRAANGGSWRITPRQKKVEEIANRYRRNLFYNRGKDVTMENGLPAKSLVQTKRFTRSAYMSSNAG